MTGGYERRYRAAMREIEAAGLRRSVAEPPQIRLMRRLGFRPRPPHYTRFGTNALAHGAPFAIVWGIMMWLLVWGAVVPWATAVVAALLAGAAFGLVVAFLYRGTAERAGLHRWENLPTQ